MVKATYTYKKRQFSTYHVHTSGSFVWNVNKLVMCLCLRTEGVWGFAGGGGVGGFKSELAIGKLKKTPKVAQKKVKLFGLVPHHSREAMRETWLFPQAVVQPAENLSGCAPVNKRSQLPRSLPRKTFIKEPSPGSARIQAASFAFARSPRTQTGAWGGNNYARPVCSPSEASLWLEHWRSPSLHEESTVWYVQLKGLACSYANCCVEKWEFWIV